MNNPTPLEDLYNVVIVRFGCEIGVKSPAVRLRYERTVCKHVEKVLKLYRVPFNRVVHVYGRAYVETNRARAVSYTHLTLPTN